MRDYESKWIHSSSRLTHPYLTEVEPEYGSRKWLEYMAFRKQEWSSGSNPVTGVNGQKSNLDVQVMKPWVKGFKRNNMPTENKEQTKTWKIEFVGFEYPNGFEIVRIIFEVTNPNGKTKVIRPKFKMQFINDYFRISGRENSIKVVKENEQLFRTWGLVKVEEIISADSNETEPDIADLKWAKKVHDSQLNPSSRPQDANIFYYIPECKIGFHNRS